jgi:predicted transcriptional regulator
MALSAISSRYRAVSSKSPNKVSRKSWHSPKRTHALLSIKPHYADAIFRGDKRFEFRRAIFRSPVETVVVYTSSPVSRVVGEFDIKGIITDKVERLWQRTRHSAGIDRTKFLSYFSGRSIGHAIVIGSVRRYPKALDLSSNFGIRPPQSFTYLRSGAGPACRA